MASVDHLLPDLLDAAGFRLEPHLFGVIWIATHLDSDMRVVGEEPGKVAREAIRRFREALTAEAQLARRQTEALQLILDAARRQYHGQHGLTSAAHQGDPLALALAEQGLL